MVKFSQNLTQGVLIRRYQRFLADVRLADGSLVTAHVSNTGAMTGCAEPGMRVWLRNTLGVSGPAVRGGTKVEVLSAGTAAGRKYPLSLELVEAKPGVLVNVNTGVANTLVREAIEGGKVRELQGYEDIRREVRLGGSRIDLLLTGRGEPRCYVEIKSVTLVEDYVALFPDSVSARGTRHLRELAKAVDDGFRAVVFFCVQRGDARELRPADGIDPVFGRQLRRAVKAGVEAIAYAAEVTTSEISLVRPLPVVMPQIPD
jgi:sugar fermentation stimulation protein A